jgi:ABC-type protease/lipase transport system fused ATPase/permease subunit
MLDESIPREQVVEAARRVRVDAAIRRFPKGYDSVLLNLERADPEARRQVLTAVADVRAMVDKRHAPFDRVQDRPV